MSLSCEKKNCPEYGQDLTSFNIPMKVCFKHRQEFDNYILSQEITQKCNNILIAIKVTEWKLTNKEGSYEKYEELLREEFKLKKEMREIIYNWLTKED